jgi:colicin import membrane protein
MAAHAIRKSTDFAWQPLAQESEESKVKSLSFSILLHAVVIGLLAYGVATGSTVEQEPAGEPIEIYLADIPKARVASPTRVAPAVRTQTKPQPKPASNLDDTTDIKPVIEPVRPPDPNSLEKPEPEPPRPTSEEVARAQKLDELIKEQQRLAEEKERVRIQQQILQDEREARARAIAEEANDAALRGNSDDPSKLAEYVSVLNATIESRSQIREGLRIGFRCEMSIKQVPGGEILAVQPTRNCNATQDEADQLIDAVLRASPLPYDGFEDVFAENLVLTFTKSRDD